MMQPGNSKENIQPNSRLNPSDMNAKSNNIPPQKNSPIFENFVDNGEQTHENALPSELSQRHIRPNENLNPNETVPPSLPMETGNNQENTPQFSSSAPVKAQMQQPLSQAVEKKNPENIYLKFINQMTKFIEFFKGLSFKEPSSRAPEYVPQLAYNYRAQMPQQQAMTPVGINQENVPPSAILPLASTQMPTSNQLSDPYQKNIQPNTGIPPIIEQKQSGSFPPETPQKNEKYAYSPSPEEQKKENPSVVSQDNNMICIPSREEIKTIQEKSSKGFEDDTKIGYIPPADVIKKERKQSAKHVPTLNKSPLGKRKKKLLQKQNKESEKLPPNPLSNEAQNKLSESSLPPEDIKQQNTRNIQRPQDSASPLSEPPSTEADKQPSTQQPKLSQDEEHKKRLNNFSFSKAPNQATNIKKELSQENEHLSILPAISPPAPSPAILPQQSIASPPSPSIAPPSSQLIAPPSSPSIAPQSSPSIAPPPAPSPASSPTSSHASSPSLSPALSSEPSYAASNNLPPASPLEPLPLPPEEIKKPSTKNLELSQKDISQPLNSQSDLAQKQMNSLLLEQSHEEPLQQLSYSSVSKTQKEVSKLQSDRPEKNESPPKVRPNEGNKQPTYIFIKLSH